MPDPPQVPDPPLSASLIFGAALPQARRYAELLAGAGVMRGLIGPREVPRLWERHLVNCAVVADLIPRSCAVIDLGSGAGLPGIVLAMMRPDCRVVLLEPVARRVAFLDECVRALGLGNAAVHRGRAEEMVGQLAGDVVVARAVAPLERLAGLALGLARPGGVVLAVKGSRAAQEVERAGTVLRRLGVHDISIVDVGGGRVGAAATVVRMSAGRRGRRALGPRKAG